MSGESFIINSPAGTFLVKSPDGRNAFDSRLWTQRLYMTGASDLAGPPNTSVFATSKLVPYGKTFAKVPYVRSVARALTGTTEPTFLNYWPPQLGWTNITVTGAQLFSGNYTNSTQTSLGLGNAMQARTLRFNYAIFENPVE